MYLRTQSNGIFFFFFLRLTNLIFTIARWHLCNMLSQINRVSGASRWHGCNSIPRFSIVRSLVGVCCYGICADQHLEHRVRANRASTDSTSLYKALQVSMKRESPSIHHRSHAGSRLLFPPIIGERDPFCAHSPLIFIR